MLVTSICMVFNDIGVVDFACGLYKLVGVGLELSLGR